MVAPSIRQLARKLLAESQGTGDPQAPDAVLVSERLRFTLTRFAGASGFASLLKRAVTMASAEIPALRAVTVTADGRLGGLEQLATHTKAESEQAAVAIAAHVLGLLVTFIGQPVTERLVLSALAGKTSQDE